MPVLRLLTLALIATASSAALAQNTTPETCGDTSNAALSGDISNLPAYYQHWHWVPNSHLTKTARCGLTPGCQGRFIEPARNWDGAGITPLSAPLNVSADTIESIGAKATMTGDVQLRKGDLSLDAGYAQYNRSNSTVLLRDNVVLRQPGILLRGQFAQIDTNRGLGELQQAEILSFQTGARGTAERIARPDYSRFEMDGASYTQCTPDNETWSLHADSIVLDYDSGRGVARGTSIRVYDVPVFYSPYLNFPVDDRRATGFLFPSIGLASNSLDISTPYYLNLAPNYDAIIAPRFIENRGEALETEFRYLNRYSEWAVSSSYLPNDQSENIDRWLIDVKEEGFVSEQWGTEIDYTKVSDIDYFSDLGLANLAVKRSTHLNQQGALNYTSDNWRGRLEVQRYQTIAVVEDPYQKLPQLRLNYQSPAKNFQLEPIIEFEYTQFDHRDSLREGGTKVTGERVYATAGTSFPMRWRWGFIEPAIKSRMVNYELEDAQLAGIDASPSASSALFSVDSGLYFERELSISDQAWTQTLEPRLFYRYSEYEEQSDQPDFDSAALTFTYQQLFRDTRFTGHDRLDDANQVALGISSRFINNAAGREVLTASVGQLHYFDDGKVQLPGDDIRKSSNSDFAAQFRLLPDDNRWFSVDLLYDARQGVLNQSNLGYHQRSDNGALFNIGYTFRREGNEFGGLENNIKQGDASVSLPLNSQWKLFAKTQYDFEDNRPVENLIGAEYQNCCWLSRVVYQRALEPDDNSGSNTSGTDNNSAVLIEFQLKGLGGLGTAVTSVLKESIFGYLSDE
ncbi:LPS-assembly protein [gamma proteobacterium BDW918]|jgi:LPS-assembly protein|uniref:LPS-assembly protein LptD n=1 Tax=Zhongshania aliphaticivorans TaxID=1470434 RepID=UPI00025C1414|nr:LPS-assembly protein [gamma proteobacterium BDW918]